MASKRKQKRDAWILRGSIVLHRRKCGHSNCRCSEGALHETWVLSYSEGGRTRIVTLRDDELPVVEAALARYREAQEGLEERVQKTVAAFQKQRQEKRASARRLKA